MSDNDNSSGGGGFPESGRSRVTAGRENENDSMVYCGYPPWT